MDGNEHTIDRKLALLLSGEGIAIEELSYDFWGGKQPDSHMNENGLIVAGYKTKGLEATQLIMINYIESGGDHR